VRPQQVVGFASREIDQRRLGDHLDKAGGIAVIASEGENPNRLRAQTLEVGHALVCPALRHPFPIRRGGGRKDGNPALAGSVKQHAVAIFHRRQEFACPNERQRSIHSHLALAAALISNLPQT
jgi:hypothetical protein